METNSGGLKWGFIIGIGFLFLLLIAGIGFFLLRKPTVPAFSPPFGGGTSGGTPHPPPPPPPPPPCVPFTEAQYNAAKNKCQEKCAPKLLIPVLGIGYYKTCVGQCKGTIPPIVEC